MFTGLIEQKGQIIANTPKGLGRRLLINSSFEGLIVGESIAVNGVCLTQIPGAEDYLAFDLSPETLRLTTLGQLNAGDFVNLERALSASSRWGGHYVTGHVHTCAYLKALRPLGEYVEITVDDFGTCASMYLLPKGSITLDGVSLTINERIQSGITLMLVPHTLEKTTLGQLKINHPFNVEFDYLARLVAHQLRIAGAIKE